VVEAVELVDEDVVWVELVVVEAVELVDEVVL